LTIDNLHPINVFFGRNNVGKSNILRALHLAFYSLKDQDMFLPDTMFHNRNIYRPIEVTVDLVMENKMDEKAKVANALEEELRRVGTVIPRGDEKYIDIRGKVNEFADLCSSFAPPNQLRVTTRMDYNEEIADTTILIEDQQSDYAFDYTQLKNAHNALKGFLRNKTLEFLQGKARLIAQALSKHRIESSHFKSLSNLVERGIIDFEDLAVTMDDLQAIPAQVFSAVERNVFVTQRDEFREEVARFGKLERPFQKAFDLVKAYFEKLSANLILIPNKEYFEKAPLMKGKEITTPVKIFDIDVFQDRLVSLIESPSKRERELIRHFNGIFGDSYPDLGHLEIRKFRDKVFAIFDTGLTALPIENQGLGVQDLYLYLAHMILFDSAIIAIEEPEGGLSTENQRILHRIIEQVYLGSKKQIFISSHSEEFESPSSYIIEMTDHGTEEISRIENEKEYEEKIPKVLIKRKLEEEKQRYEALLKEVTERQMALDILNYINKLADKEKVDPEKISHELGYKKELVEKILREIVRRKR
jgi:hypothetical protein